MKLIKKFVRFLEQYGEWRAKNLPKGGLWV